MWKENGMAVFQSVKVCVFRMFNRFVLTELHVTLTSDIFEKNVFSPQSFVFPLLKRLL